MKLFSPSPVSILVGWCDASDAESKIRWPVMRSADECFPFTFFADGNSSSQRTDPKDAAPKSTVLANTHRHRHR